jgi:phenylalanyl-tRNA synthetase beta chain
VKLTLSWLKEHLDTDADADAITQKLTAIGLEVESVSDAGAALKDFVVAKIVTAEKHPNADKLRLCMVDDASGVPLQIVCGAPNARAGIKVVLARPGTVIPASGEALKVGTIRGVESRGMLCSGRELLLSEESDGIIELPADAKVGAPVAAALGLTDPVIDVAITPNRGDAASVYGIARDLAAAGLGELRAAKIEKVPGKFVSPKKITLDFSAENKDACPIFAGRLIKGVKNGPSPKWIQERMKAVGLKPISALVDVTNLIAQEYGRPLHVFDADRLNGGLCARMAKDGESVRALDDENYTLDDQTIVIADGARACSIAGIMGGADSGCSLETANVFLESALFDPLRIARSGRKLGIISDARYRFERGVDPQFVLPGLELATKMILALCGGEASEIVVAGAASKPPAAIAFDPGFVAKLGGLDVPAAESVRILKNLGFTIDGGKVTPPSWRSDISGPADLVEEVIRIHGINKVPPAPMMRPAAVAKPVLTPAQRRARTARRALAARGFNECVSFTFIARGTAEMFGGGDAARQLANPIAADLDALRPSLLPSLLAAAARNQARGFPQAMLFEIGAQFESGVPGAQSNIACAIRSGAGVPGWLKTAEPADAFAVKADMLRVLEATMGAPMTAPVKQGAPNWYHPGRSGTLALGPKTIATFGELHPRIIAAFDLKGPVAGFEIFLDALPDGKSRKARPPFTPSPFQAIERDFAFVLDAGVSAETLTRAAKAADRALIESVTVFDVYEGPGVDAGKKSLAIRVRLQPKDKTPTDAEIEAVATRIVAQVAKVTGAGLRG